MERFNEMGDSTRGQAAAGPGQMSRDGDTLCTGRVSGRTCLMRAGTLVIIIVDFPELVIQVLRAVRLKMGVGGPEPGVLDGLSLMLGRVVFGIVIFGVNSRRLARIVVW